MATGRTTDYADYMDPAQTSRPLFPCTAACV
jgi:hypothetical protein